MLRPDTDTWIFDLDDTLYPRASGLHEQMRMRVVRFIQELIGCDAEAAASLHAEYYHRYGTSMIGLSRHHGVQPMDFLAFVHEIDLAALDVTGVPADALAALPGRRLVFTNGSAAHARRILSHLRIDDLFDGICDIEACAFVGKPAREAYDAFLSRHEVDPLRSVFFDDREVNLRVPFDLGMQTVLIGDRGEENSFPHVHVCSSELGAILAKVSAGGVRVSSPELKVVPSTL